MDIKQQIDDVLERFPELTFNHQENTFTGEIAVFENDFYSVLIDIDRWNNGFPKVYEIGERIPHELDRHVFEDTGNCCFTTPRLEEIYLKTKVKTLAHFIERIVVPYLQNNSYYELYKTYFFGEFSHSDAILETYQTLLKITDPSKVVLVLCEYFQENRRTDKDSCYCGSGKTFRKCNNGLHKIGYQQLEYINKKHIENDLIYLYKKFEPQ